MINDKTHQQINVRIRQIFNIFVKFDPNVITKIIYANDRELNHLLHNLRDVFICDNTELVCKFWKYVQKRTKCSFWGTLKQTVEVSWCTFGVQFSFVFPRTNLLLLLLLFLLTLMVVLD